MNLKIVALLISTIVSFLKEASANNEGVIVFGSDDVRFAIQKVFHDGKITRAELVYLIDEIRSSDIFDYEGDPLVEPDKLASAVKPQ